MNVREKGIRNGLMVLNILEIGHKTKQTGLVSYFIQMETSMREIGTVTKLTEMENMFTLMGLFMKDNGSLISSMD
jgi:hypothetical protein